MPLRTTRSAARKAQDLFAQGLQLHQRHQLAAARSCYEQALRCQARHVDSLGMLGALCTQQRDFPTAQRLLQKALRLQPGNATLHTNLGTVLQERGQLADALAQFDQAIALAPQSPLGHYNRGNALRALRQWEAAIASYTQALACKPDLHQALENCANLQLQLGQSEAAARSWRRYLGLQPQSAQGHYQLGIALRNQGLLEPALASFEAACALQPTLAVAHFQRGNTLKLLARPQDAIGAYDQAIALQPDFAEAWANRGITLHESRQLDRAIASYDQAIALQSSHAQAHWNKALALLAQGQLAQGWALYPWRWQVPEFTTQPLRSSKPLWAGQPARSVLLWAEQGVGEELMFASCLADARQRCQRLIVQVDARLVPLFTRSFAAELAQFVPKQAQVPEEAYDFQLPLGGLCQFLRPDAAHFPRSSTGFLRADAQRSRAIAQALPKALGRKRCGISWHCRNALTGAKRSLELQQLLAALAQTNCQCINLQYGDTRAEVAQLPEGLQLTDCAEVDNFRDLDGLAALIDSCDCVVSVDNSTAHLAAALGKDTRVLLPYFPDWRWQLEGPSSLWYPSMRLYRQQQPGQWDEVLAQVLADW